MGKRYAYIASVVFPVVVGVREGGDLADKFPDHLSSSFTAKCGVVLFSGRDNLVPCGGGRVGAQRAEVYWAARATGDRAAVLPFIRPKFFIKAETRRSDPELLKGVLQASLSGVAVRR